MELEEKEICPKCKKKFSCSKSNKCWCYEIGLDSNQLAKLNTNYEYCLCPNCIEELKNQNKP
ncbi:MAG: cysteine-rich CWC family protein [Bacteroidetes bacterium]|nr:cysteine-rich CWC family protein [Bacteroidota bacterium]